MPNTLQGKNLLMSSLKFRANRARRDGDLKAWAVYMQSIKRLRKSTISCEVM